MVGMKSTAHPESCCGCGACAKACPRQCIRMAVDEDGFVFPQVDADACVHCGRCEQVCPFERKPEVGERIQPKIYAARQRSEAVLMAVASGGAFSGIATALAEGDPGEDWWVWGAVLDENLQVRHQCRRLSEGLESFHKSKYVQSDLGDALPEIRRQLEAEERVLFSGTPCQVAALRNYLGAGPIQDRLFCVDLVCHGVPSQLMFDRYIEEEGRALKSPVKQVEFRHKVYRGRKEGWDSRYLRLTLADGRQKVLNRYQSRFLRAYHAYLFQRMSCYACPFSTAQRNGDVTIADFWGVKRLLPGIDENKGISLIQVNTAAGERIIARMDREMEIWPVDREAYLKQSGSAMVKPATASRNRKAFFIAARDNSFFQAVDSAVPAWKEWAKIEIMRRLGPEARRKLKRLRHGHGSGAKG